MFHVKHPTLEVTITAMSHGPDGVGRLPDGRVVFGPGAAPGDRVSVRLAAEHATWCRAELLAILEPGQHRREPRCRHHRSGECGGCPWQHLEASEQRHQKEALIAREAARFCPEAAINPIRSVSEWGYRRRARFGHRGPTLGYRARATPRVFALEECPILRPELEGALPHIRRAAAVTPDGNFDAMVDPQGALKLGRDATPFAQPSEEAERLLVAEVLRFVPADAPAVLELFAGAGTFTVPLLARGHAVTAIEGDAATVKRLRDNAPTAAVLQADLFRVDVGQFFPSCNAALLDPPRAGAAPCLEALAATRAAVIVYVSCEPATLFRDLARLRELGYQVTEISPFDAFPQTPHIETVVRCSRTSSP